MQVAIVGAGAVGCYYGGLLLRAGHDVTFIRRQPHVDAINAHGLLLDTESFNGHLPAKATTDTTALASPDLVLVCVKLADTEQAGRSLAGRLLPETSVLSLQNGDIPTTGGNRLRDYSLLEDLAKIRCQAAVVAGQHLVKALLGLIGCCPRLLFAARGFRLVFLHL